MTAERQTGMNSSVQFTSISFIIKMQFFIYLTNDTYLCYNVNRSKSNHNALASTRNSFGTSLFLRSPVMPLHIPSVDWRGVRDTTTVIWHSRDRRKKLTYHTQQQFVTEFFLILVRAVFLSLQTQERKSWNVRNISSSLACLSPAHATWSHDKYAHF
jgi:hypothetical protein